MIIVCLLCVDCLLRAVYLLLVIRFVVACCWLHVVCFSVCVVSRLSFAVLCFGVQCVVCCLLIVVCCVSLDIFVGFSVRCLMPVAVRCCLSVVYCASLVDRLLFGVALFMVCRSSACVCHVVCVDCCLLAAVRRSSLVVVRCSLCVACCGCVAACCCVVGCLVVVVCCLVVA